MFRLLADKRGIVYRYLCDAKTPCAPKGPKKKSKNDSKKVSQCPPTEKKGISCNVKYPCDPNDAKKSDPKKPVDTPEYKNPCALKSSKESEAKPSTPSPCSKKTSDVTEDKNTCDSKGAKESDDKKPTPPKKTIDPRRVFKVYRFGGIKSEEAPDVQNYELDVSTCGKMVLDALLKLKEMDPTLTFRRSCREGICGSCGVCVQGTNCLACITKIPDAKTITVYPLPHMYVIRDLVVDMSHFFNALDSIRPYLIRKETLQGAMQSYAQSVPDSLKMVGLYECVLCGCCSTACPSYWWNGRRFLGPAALLHVYRWIIDSRDEGQDQRLYALRDDFQAFRCHSIYNCSLACPKHLNPGRAIAKLKRLIAGLDKKPRPEMDPMRLFTGSGLESCKLIKKPEEKQEPRNSCKNK